MKPHWPDELDKYSSRTPTRLHLLGKLQRSSSPITVREIAPGTEVSETAVRQFLELLVHAKFAKKAGKKPTRYQWGLPIKEAENAPQQKIARHTITLVWQDDLDPNNRIQITVSGLPAQGTLKRVR